MKGSFLAFGILFNLACLAQTLEVKPYAPELFPDRVSGAVCGFSKDGQTIYFVKEDTLKKKLFLYQAAKAGEKWSNARLLSFSGIDNDYGGRITPDGSTFYFTSDRPGGSPKENDAWNIWVTHLVNNRWSSPTPLPATNNRGSECCPLPMDGKVLMSATRDQSHEWWISILNPRDNSEIFANNLNGENSWQWPSSFDEENGIFFFNSMKRPDTKGMDDIYISFYDKEGFGKPVNIGSPVNSKEYEDDAILSPDHKWLIFCRHETGSTPSRVVCVEWGPVLRGLR